MHFTVDDDNVRSKAPILWHAKTFWSSLEAQKISHRCELRQRKWEMSNVDSCSRIIEIQERREKVSGRMYPPRGQCHLSRREIPKHPIYHDVFMGILPSSRRGNASRLSVG
ncbi:hypothetical protein TNCV_1983881, partial [Trichonephila clavipes]